MKVVIMAGGLGKRAIGIDDSVPKPLIRIGTKPILQWEIECLVRQGYNDIILTVSYMAEKIEEYFKDGSNYGCHILYYVEKEPIGNAGALFILREENIINGDFLLLNADSMFDVNFERMLDYHCEKGALATVLTHPNDHPTDSGVIISTPDGMIKEWFTKEDDRPKWLKNRVNSGIHILNTDLLEISEIDVNNIDGMHKIDLDRDLLKPLIKSRRLFAYDSTEYVKDMGTPKRFKQVSKDIETGKVRDRNLINKQKAIFLDRDGTINKLVGFLRNIDNFELIDGVAEAIHRINDSGYLAIVITNQPVIARGELSVKELEEIHNKMETLLGEEGSYIDAIYYCPHHPDSGYEGEIKDLKIECDCRKPKPGLILKASKDYNIDLSKSWMIGDEERDIIAGKNAGCGTILIGKEDFGQDYRATSLLEAISNLGL